MIMMLDGVPIPNVFPGSWTSVAARISEERGGREVKRFVRWITIVVLSRGEVVGNERLCIWDI